MNTRRFAATLVALVALTLTAAVARAQDRPSPIGLPCATPDARACGAALAAAGYPAASLQSDGGFTGTVDRSDARFDFVLGAFLTAAGSDVALSMYKIGNGSAREAGFGAWWQDSPVAFAVTKSAVSAAFAYELQRLHQTRPKAAFVVGIAATAIEASLVARTAQLQTIPR